MRAEREQIPISPKPTMAKDYLMNIYYVNLHDVCVERLPGSPKGRRCERIGANSEAFQIYVTGKKKTRHVTVCSKCQRILSHFSFAIVGFLIYSHAKLHGCFQIRGKWLRFNIYIYPVSAKHADIHDVCHFCNAEDSFDCNFDFNLSKYVFTTEKTLLYFMKTKGQGSWIH